MSRVKGIYRCSEGEGELFYYNAYRDAVHAEALRNDLYRLLSREQGWEAVMRVRCSRGVSIKHYYGYFYRCSRA